MYLANLALLAAPLVHGKVWVKPEMRDDGLIYWAADSDSQLTKGLAALLVNGLSGCKPQEILQLQVGIMR